MGGVDEAESVHVTGTCTGPGTLLSLIALSETGLAAGNVQLVIRRLVITKTRPLIVRLSADGRERQGLRVRSSWHSSLSIKLYIHYD